MIGPTQLSETEIDRRCRRRRHRRCLRYRLHRWRHFSPCVSLKLSISVDKSNE